MKIVYIIGLILAHHCLPAFSMTPDPGEDDTYSTEARLFHIERSKNRNIVCYDLHADATDKPDEKSPMLVYWVNREEYPGKQGSLSYIQQKLAYGYTITGSQNGVITIELNAVKGRKITIEQNNQKYFCRIEINQQPSTLSKVYVKTKTSNSLQVEYIDIHGYNLETGVLITERITP